ncbi:MAG: hypothetical protein IKZ21_02610 [Clostridia bacterium]|nr:hypothetical protein [Clostridia bacterium]
MKENPCREYHILMQAVLDGVAVPSDEAKWREHAESCESCRELYRELESLKKAIPGTMAEPPYGLDETILKAILTEDKQRKLHIINRRQHMARSMVGIAAAAAILVAGSWTLSRYGEKAVDSTFRMESEEEIVLEESADSEMFFSDEEKDETGVSTNTSSVAEGAESAVPGLEDNGIQTDRTAILANMQDALAGLDLNGAYKTCTYLDCENLPEGRERYRVSGEVVGSSLAFYSTDDYLGFINGAELELNFSLELTESEMQDCGLTTNGNLTLIAVATPIE